ncbi:MAG TPA: hypothetical protein VIC51_01255 [Psychromonas sp.]
MSSKQVKLSDTTHEQLTAISTARKEKGKINKYNHEIIANLVNKQFKKEILK